MFFKKKTEEDYAREQAKLDREAREARAYLERVKREDALKAKISEARKEKFKRSPVGRVVGGIREAASNIEFDSGLSKSQYKKYSKPRKSKGKNRKKRRGNKYSSDSFGFGSRGLFDI